MSPQTKALLGSYGRVFLAAALGCYLTLGKAPLDLRLDDATALLNAGIGALIVTVVNYLRRGETRFGKGAEDVGMGGEDTLGVGGDDKVVLEPPAGSRAARVQKVKRRRE